MLGFRSICGLFLGVAMSAGLAAAASAACPTSGAQYATSFSEADDAWDSGDHMKLGGGTFSMFPDADRTGNYFYNGDKFTSGTVCADVTLATPGGKDPSAGLVFWAVDGKNFFFLNFDPQSKNISVSRVKDGEFFQVVDWKKVAGLDAIAPLAPVQMTVKILGQHASASIDGVTAVNFSISSAPENWFAGLHAESASDIPVTWNVTDFAVSK